jgi:hypothetical protein
VSAPPEERRAILKALRNQSEETTAGIAKARITAGGQLLFELAKSCDSEKLANNIRSLTKATVRKLVPLKTVHIYEMDEGTTEEELAAALVAAIGEEGREAVKIHPLRPGRRGTINATAKVPAGEGTTELLRAGKLKVGFLRCPIRERTELTRCYRCLEYGHTARTCTATDRSSLCRNCAEPGHEAKSCSAVPRCPICTDRGADPSHAQHRAGSARCPATREEQSRVRR